MKTDIAEDILKLIEKHMTTAGAGLNAYQLKALKVIIPTIIFRYMK
jgi:hypothetical protein